MLSQLTCQRDHCTYVKADLMASIYDTQTGDIVKEYSATLIFQLDRKWNGWQVSKMTSFKSLH